MKKLFILLFIPVGCVYTGGHKEVTFKSGKKELYDREWSGNQNGHVTFFRNDSTFFFRTDSIASVTNVK